jgi:hypothetical protein
MSILSPHEEHVIDPREPTEPLACAMPGFLGYPILGDGFSAELVCTWVSSIAWNKRKPRRPLPGNSLLFREDIDDACLATDASRGSGMTFKTGDEKE